MDSLPDKLTIETPEQSALDFPLAGIGSRFLATLVDSAIQFVAIFALWMVALILAIPGFGVLGLNGSVWIIALMVLAVFIVNLGYFALFEIIWNGQTPGKRYANLRVMKDDGRPISAYDAIARNLMRIVDQLPGMYAVGVLSAFFSKQNKRLGDYVAGTVVVREEKVAEERPFLETQRDASAAAYDTSKLTIEEVRLMETFFSRRDNLDPGVRTQMAWQISQRIGTKFGVTVHGWPATENFLEAVHKEYRATGRLGVK
jgi:uncharacterized RDD family membrane protein YckC